MSTPIISVSRQRRKAFNSKPSDLTPMEGVLFSIFLGGLAWLAVIAFWYACIRI
jgi:hypothetical protein